jgi:hypothetical protein
MCGSCYDPENLGENRMSTTKSPPTESVSFRLPSYEVAEVDRLAAETGITRSAQLADLVHRALAYPSILEMTEKAVTKIEAATERSQEILDLVGEVSDRLIDVEQILKPNK